MVFESVVAEILNRFLGDYVENLDSKQLKIGIWGGDVVLENLLLKQQALADLDLPVAVTFGRLGKLVLKIPWKNLYGEPVIVEIEKLLLVAVPNVDIVYNAEKEEKYLQDIKQAELAKIDESKRKELMKGQTKTDDTFVEKLTTQIIKNVQIKIKDIHIRYEDKSSQIPFAMGVTLSNLTVLSTDENWLLNINATSLNEIYKILQLDSLAVYLNIGTELYAHLSPNSIVDSMQSDIISKVNIPKNYNYILGPINADARLKLVPKPENTEPSFSIPKVLLNLELDKLKLALNKTQYQKVMIFVDSMQRMTLAAPYRKYRPNVNSYRGHYKEWWKFAYTCILENEVRRRRRNWDINHIMNHINLRKKYSEYYKEKLLSPKKISVELKNNLDECEKQLDIFNIVLVRQQVEVEVSKLDLLAKKKAEEQSWWKGWFSKPKGEDETEKDSDIFKKFEAAMTPEEKAKLYQAIDYTESFRPTEFPKEYVAISLAFALFGLEIDLCDEVDKPVLKLSLQEVKCRVDQRPRMDALKVNVKINQFQICGVEQQNITPKLITSKDVEEHSLFEAVFETNPLDEKCQQRIIVSSRPLQVTYDAQTIIQLVNVFETPKEVNLDQLKDIASLKMADFKEKSGAGLVHAIEKHLKLEVDINLSSTYIIVPQGGFYETGENVLVADLGNIIIQSVDVQNNELISWKKDSTANEVFEELSSKVYENYKFEIKNIQILLTKKGEDWQNKIKDGVAQNFHILHPTSLAINLGRCMVTDDPRLPKLKVSGCIPDITINTTDKQVLSLTSLVMSIPLPAATSEPQNFQRLSSTSTVSMMHLTEKLVRTYGVQEDESIVEDNENIVQLTEIYVQFEMKNLTFIVWKETISTVDDSQRKDDNENDFKEKVLTFRIYDLEFELNKQTFNQIATARLGGVSFHQYYNNITLPVLKTAREQGSEEYLFISTFTTVDKKSPEFKTKYESCEQILFLEFRKLDILLHQEALICLLQFISDLQTSVNTLMYVPPTDSTRPDFITLSQTRALSVIAEETTQVGKSLVEEQITKRRVKRSKKKSADMILLKVDARLHEVSINIANATRELASLAVRGLYTDVILKKSSVEISAVLQQIYVKDPNPSSIYHDILNVTTSETLRISIIIYTKDELRDTDTNLDLSVNLRVNTVRIIFLNWFVSSMLNFLNNFQAAQEAIKDASAKAAETAKQNVQSAYENASRIKLNINLNAPEIIMPTNSTSKDAILVDLGHLSLTNSIVTFGEPNSEGLQSVIDEMHIVLENMKLSCVSFDTKFEISKECIILEPVTIILEVQRNLTPIAFAQIPDIDISGKLEKIQLNLSHEDYDNIMLTLSKNFSEGQQQSDKIEPKHSDPIRKSNVSKLAVTPSTVLPDNLLEEADKVNIFLKFSFTLDNLIIDLFDSAREIREVIKGEKITYRKFGLARFNLNVLSVKGRILSDQTIITSVVLVDCILDDTRGDSENCISRLFQRRQDNEKSSSSGDVSSTKNMIDVTFQQKANNMFVDVRICSFDLIVATDYLLMLSNFFQVNSQDEQSQVQLNLHKTPSTSNLQKLSPSPDQIPSSMTVNIRLEQPDIVLVETTRNVNVDAININCELLLKARISGSHQVISGSIKDFTIYTCKYENRKLCKGTMNSIINPVSISLAGSTPSGGDFDEGLHLDVIVTDVRIRVSPATIELLTRILAGLSTQQQTLEAQKIQQFDYLQLWDEKEFKDPDFWFLKTEEALEVDEFWVTPATPSGPAQIKNEMCLISVPSILITLEAGVGNQTLPMIFFETKLNGVVGNWSSQMYVDAALSVQMAYYNSTLAIWEPLIEPNEYYKDDKTISLPWELKLEMQIKTQEDLTSPTSSVTDLESAVEITPQQCITISSKENLELTISKTCLEVVKNLGKAFQNAMEKHEVHVWSENAAPFRIINDTGLEIKLHLQSSAFMVEGNPDCNEVQIGTGGEVPLELRDKNESLGVVVEYRPLDTDVLTSSDTEGQNKNVVVKIKGSKNAIDLPIVRADKRYFPFVMAQVPQSPSVSKWGIVSDIKEINGCTIITIRSVVQIHNHFDQAIDVYHLSENLKEVKLINTVQPHNVLNLPLNVVHSQSSELFFGLPGYSITSQPFVWKGLQHNLAMTELLECHPKDKNRTANGFFIRAMGEIEQVYNENTFKHTMLSVDYHIHLRPSVLFRNCLPYPVILCISGSPKETSIEPGHLIHLPTVQPDVTSIVVRLDNYLDKTWSCKRLVQNNPPEFSVWAFDSYDSSLKMTLDLGIFTTFKQGSMTLSLYCPSWMVNKTGKMLTYRDSPPLALNSSLSLSCCATGNHPTAGNSEDALNILYHPENFKGPILFSFNSKNFFGKKKASIRIENSEWSNKFSIDVAGSSGVVVCKSPDINYQIGVTNQLTYNGLTKQIVFTPLYIIINNAPFSIEVQEVDRPGDPWYKVPANECTPLWPRSNKDDKLFRLRIVDTIEISPPFLITEVHTTLLKLSNIYGGVNVDLQIQEGATYITFSPYEPGLAPALIINHTNNSIQFWEKESINIRTIDAHNYMYYAWENPAGKKLLNWDSGKKNEIEADLRKDDLGEFLYSQNDKIKMYWVSFLDGLQRILLFTDQQAVVQTAQAAGDLELITQEINISIHGIGLSLVNNDIRKEIMYLGIASSGIIWEAAKLKSDHFKSLTMHECGLIEQAYQNYQQQLIVNSDQEISPRILVDQKLEVDFQEQMMLRPNRRRLRRTFQTGLWVQMKTSKHQLQLHAKINRIQIDNQLYDCIFPVVLAPVPPPKSVVANSALKPFIELSIVQRIMKHSSVQQFKYFSVLIQEFHVKVDMGFINAILNCVAASEPTEEETLEYFKNDLMLADQPLYSHVSTQTQQDIKNFYDLLHFSPLKIHVSFSLQDTPNPQGGRPDESTTPAYLSVLLQGIGVTLTDMQDVVFRLAYFERNYVFLTQKELISEASMHYVGQLVKQLYVLVLGLDVIGNPYGLVLGITKGVEDLFYEPFQGAIQGPGEFAEGLVLGVRSLFGHTVGGAAGAVSRITGAMGKGIAALSMDEEYQRRRRDLMNKRPANIQEGIARGGKGLVMGVVDGVTGVFVKPVSGAKEQGVEGFFKGLGKGAIGLVARPAAGVVDFASGTFESVKRATEGEDVGRLRAPRFISSEGFILPYCRREAEGYKLLMELEKGKYANTDIYSHHCWIIPRREILLLTDKRIAYVVHNDIFGGWQVDWALTWQEIHQPPKVNEKGIYLANPEPKKKVFGIFGSSENGKLITLPESNSRQELYAKIMTLYKANHPEYQD